MTSVNSILNAIGKSDQIKDFAHASRLFVDNNYELQPRYSHLFHVVFNLTPQAAKLFGNQEKLEINMLVKSIDLPSFNMDVQTHNQYNRQVHSQHKINYNPVNIAFHDDQNDLIRSLLHSYASFYYQDSRYASNDRAYSTNDRYGAYSNSSYGLASGQDRFFRDIRVYSMLQKRFAEYTLINPIVNAFNHDTHSYASGNLMQHTMQVNYETVKYATGFVNNVNPKGFGEVHYDKTPSPLGVFGSGTDNSIFFRGGFVDAVNTVARDLADGNILGAIARGATIFNNTKDVDLGRVLEKDLTRVLGGVLRGKNPLSDVVLPNIFGLDTGKLIGDIVGTDGDRVGGTGAPVDRTFNPPGKQQIAFSNGSNRSTSVFNQGTSFVEDIIDRGLSVIAPSLSRSPASPRFLSDGTRIVSSNSLTNSKLTNRIFLENRIQQLDAEIADNPRTVPQFIINERDAIKQRLALEFGIK